MPSSAGPSSPAAALAEALENSSRLIDKHLQEDRCFPELSELLSVPSHSEYSSWMNPGGATSVCSLGFSSKTLVASILCTKRLC
uniref:Uncharacterized protein n=1 Tax=Oryzias melastigma TaxID=30732 RepID=A0A3B3B9V2_ORYME